MTKDVEKFFRKNLTMYPHLKAIRDRLWTNNGKSRVSVMIGAGFSLNAKKVESNFVGMALWNDLKNRLVQNLSHYQDIQEHKDVLEIGQIYVEEYGKSSLDEILKEVIPDDNYEPDELHYSLLNLPWTDIYTTNYHTLLERAKKSVYERNYQVVYDINEFVVLYNLVLLNYMEVFLLIDHLFLQKRIMMNIQKNYPLLNMVQQSIMETTFILLGFSGDDPNFSRWTTWVLNNLGEHMLKIYMIGYGQKHRQSELRAKGITLIDFEELREAQY